MQDDSQEYEKSLFYFHYPQMGGHQFIPLVFIVTIKVAHYKSLMRPSAISVVKYLTNHTDHYWVIPIIKSPCILYFFPLLFYYNVKTSNLRVYNLPIVLNELFDSLSYTVCCLFMS